MPIFDKLKKLFFGRNSVSSSEAPTHMPREQEQALHGESEGGLPKSFESQTTSPESRLEHAALSINESPVFDQQQNQTQVIQMSIQSQFRVINESIDIARKSKNPDTRKSRIGVARNMLKEARAQAARFCIDVDGFEQAESAIKSLQDAFDSNASGTSQRSAVVEMETLPPLSNPSRELLKEATVLKKQKKFDAACEKLREAYVADGSESLMIEDRLRLPMYLLLAGKGEDGWDELNRLNASYTDEFCQAIIANQMRVFQKKEGKDRVVKPLPEEARNHSSGPKTIGDLQTEPLSAWGDDSLISGLEFHATMQLRTPLRVLTRHGELHTDRDAPPPKIVEQAWEGIWTYKIKTWEELGIDLKEFPESTVASDIGFMQFLIAFRQNIEDVSLSIDEKISRVRELCNEPEFHGVVAGYGGPEELLERAFPRVIASIDGISATAKKSLIDAGFICVERIDQASDGELLALNGMGAVRLSKLRAFCNTYAGEKSLERFANV